MTARLPQRIAALVLGGCLLCLCACQKELMNSLPEPDANEVLACLYSSGIQAEKQPALKGLYALQVEEADMARAITLLRAAGLPRSRYETLGGVFKKEGMVSTPLEEQARLIYALSQEVAGSIALIDGVLDARVHVVLPASNALGDKISPSSAAVFIRHRADISLEADVSRIKKLVEHSIEGLQYEGISVYLFPAALHPPLPESPMTRVLGLGVPQRQSWLVWLLAAGWPLALALGGYGAWQWRQRHGAGRNAEDAAAEHV